MASAAGAAVVAAFGRISLARLARPIGVRPDADQADAVVVVFGDVHEGEFRAAGRDGALEVLDVAGGFVILRVGRHEPRRPPVVPLAIRVHDAEASEQVDLFVVGRRPDLLVQREQAEHVLAAAQPVRVAGQAVELQKLIAGPLDGEVVLRADAADRVDPVERFRAARVEGLEVVEGVFREDVPIHKPSGRQGCLFECRIAGQPGRLGQHGAAQGGRGAFPKLRRRTQVGTEVRGNRSGRQLLRLEESRVVHDPGQNPLVLVEVLVPEQQKPAGDAHGRRIAAAERIGRPRGPVDRAGPLTFFRVVDAGERSALARRAQQETQHPVADPPQLRVGPFIAVVADAETEVQVILPGMVLHAQAVFERNAGALAAIEFHPFDRVWKLILVGVAPPVLLKRQHLGPNVLQVAPRVAVPQMGSHPLRYFFRTAGLAEK